MTTSDYPPPRLPRPPPGDASSPQRSFSAPRTLSVQSAGARTGVRQPSSIRPARRTVEADHSNLQLKEVTVCRLHQMDPTAYETVIKRFEQTSPEGTGKKDIHWHCLLGAVTGHTRKFR
ncbi:hypothetical protein ACHAWF_018167 [Thalassiosira exigua]